MSKLYNTAKAEDVQALVVHLNLNIEYKPNVEDIPGGILAFHDHECKEVFFAKDLEPYIGTNIYIDATDMAPEDPDQVSIIKTGYVAASTFVEFIDGTVGVAMDTAGGNDTIMFPSGPIMYMVDWYGLMNGDRIQTMYNSGDTIDSGNFVNVEGAYRIVSMGFGGTMHELPIDHIAEETNPEDSDAEGLMIYVRFSSNDDYERNYVLRRIFVEKVD